MTAGSLRAEIWSRPGSLVHERIVLEIPGPFNFTKRMAGGVGQGDITVPATWDRINDVIRRVPGQPISDIRRLVKVFQERQSGVAQVAYEFFLDVTGDEAREDFTQIQGPGIESIMADATVYPWDWNGENESTSTFPDWVWGGKDVVGPVEVSFIPHIFKVWNTATGGTLNIDVSINGGGFQSATVAFNATAATVRTALIALANVDDAEVQGAGTATNPWEIQIIAPAGSYTTAVNGAALTGALPRAFIELEQFGKLIPIGWTTSFNPSNGLQHGVVTDFRASLGGGADPVLPAGCDAWIVFLGQEVEFPGVQKIVRVTPGAIFQVPDDMILYAQGAGATLRVVIRDLNEGFIAAEEITLVANTPTNINGLVNVMIPEGITEVIFRIGHIGAGTPPRIFIACPSMREGLAPTTAGGIIDPLFDDATVDHVVDFRLVWENLAIPGTSYLIPTFTTVTDSAGVIWDQSELTFTAQRGKTYLQVLTDLLNLHGYKWTVTPHPTTSGLWNLNLYNGTWVDTDATALSSPAINIGSGVTGGPIFRSHLTGNAVTVEGQNMQFGRSLSPESVTSVGRREVYQPDRSLLNNAMASLRAAQEVTERLLSGLSVSVTVDPVNGPYPLLDYDVDWLINVQVPPVLSKSAHRLASITANVGPDSQQFKLSFSSEAFAGVQGVMEGVRRLMLKFEGLERVPPEQVDTPINLGGGGAPTIVVAANDSTQYSKARADLICTGVDDAGTIQLAINKIAAGNRYGRVILCEGNYRINCVGGQTAITCPVAVTILGLGRENTGFLVNSYTGSGAAVIIQFSTRFYIRDVGFFNNQSTDVVAIRVTGGNGDISNCRFDTDGKAMDFTGAEVNVLIADNLINNTDTVQPSVDIESGLRFHIRNNLFFGGLHAVRVENASGELFITHNYVDETSEENLKFAPGAGAYCAEEVTIIGNHLLQAGTGGVFSGIKIDTTRTATESGLAFHILGNIIEFPISRGIELVNANQCRIVGNYIEESGRHGISLNASSDNMIHDNYIWYPSQTTDITYDGIFLEGDSNDNSIQANQFIKKAATFRTRYAVNVSAAACDRTVIVSNQMRNGYTTAAINDAGTGTITLYPAAAAPLGDNFG